MPGIRPKNVYDEEQIQEWITLYKDKLYSQNDLTAYEAANGRPTAWKTIKAHLLAAGVKLRSLTEQYATRTEKQKRKSYGFSRKRDDTPNP